MLEVALSVLLTLTARDRVVEAKALPVVCDWCSYYKKTPYTCCFFFAFFSPWVLCFPLFSYGFLCLLVFPANKSTRCFLGRMTKVGVKKKQNTNKHLLGGIGSLEYFGVE